MDDILVSINCITYNQENYIADAIESFLMQKTNFKYEILIHDDASTDNTANIIREYQQKYPDVIKPIYQVENQYSKKVQVDKLNIQRAKGKYIAVCEGDDYWTDPYKLQKQFDYMEKHPECSLCIHAGYVVSAIDKKIIRKNRPAKYSRFISVEEIIERGGDFCVTNSMFYRSKFDQDRPDFFQMIPEITDYPLGIHLALQGTVYYIDEFLSAYRVGDSGSWSVRNFSRLENKRKHYNKMGQFLDAVNIYTKLKYEDTILKTKNITEIFLLVEERKFREAKTGIYKDFYMKLGLRRKIIFTLDKYLPVISNFLRTTRRGF